MACALLAQLSLTYQPGVTEGDNVHFVRDKFRSFKSDTSMRSVSSRSINIRTFHAVIFRGIVCFLVSTALREVPGDRGKTTRVKYSRQFLVTFSSPFPTLRWVSSAVIEKAAQTPKRLPSTTSAPLSKERPESTMYTGCSYDFQCTYTYRFVACPSPQDEVIGWDKGLLMSCTNLLHFKQSKVGLRRAR